MPKHIVFNVPTIKIGLAGSDVGGKPPAPTPVVEDAPVVGRFFGTGAAIALAAAVAANAGDTVSGTVDVAACE